MAQQAPRNYPTRITLPSGKELDVVTYTPGLPRSAPAAPTPLSVCTACGHDRVQPTAWAEVSGTSWRVTLRCPDCERQRESVFGQDELDAFDIALDEGTRALAADLDLLARANMAEEIERFANAVRSGHIVPEDF